MHSSPRWLLTAFLPLVVACGSDDDAPTDHPEDDSGPMTPAPKCSAPPFLASETAGITVADPKAPIQARVVSADHSPPMFGYNDWTLALLDGSGAPLTNAKIAWACSWMP